METEEKRPLLVAAGIALVVMALLACLRVDLHRCSYEQKTQSEWSVQRVGSGGQPQDRTLRLWLDAGDLEDALEAALHDELARSTPRVALQDSASRRGRVTIRVDDASLYTPLYASADLTAVMRLETGTGSSSSPSARGETRVELTGACYGVVSPSAHRNWLAGALGENLAKALQEGLDK